MKYRLGACAAMLLLAACQNGGVDGEVKVARSVPDAGFLPTLARAAPATRISIASAPDHGALMEYGNGGKPMKREGAHTWYPVQVSEEHAIRAIVDGEMTIPYPDGTQAKLRYERHVEGADGNWSWIGRVEGGDPGQEAILTFGEQAVFASIPQRNGQPPLELRSSNGRLWAVTADPDKLVIPDSAGDTRIPGPHPSEPIAASTQAEARHVTASAVAAAATQTAGNTIDVVIGYSSGFRAAQGSQSAAVTRLNFLIEVGNQTFRNSNVNGYLRLVHAMEVNYTDATDNVDVLHKLTGSDGDGNVSVPTSLTPLRTARGTYGADVVVLLRKFTTPENDGCGVAWLNGQNGRVIDPVNDDSFAYAVVSDGTDAGADGKSYYCPYETLVHEVAHLAGSAHEKANAPEQGRYPYSYGYVSSVNNFHTVMAYGEGSQTTYRVFSNPAISFCGGNACGNSTADNASSLNNTISVVAKFRSSVVGVGDVGAPFLRSLDANGDGYSDFLFFIHSENRFVIWYMKNGTRVATQSVPIDGNLSFVDGGDLNGDGFDDLVFSDKTNRRLIVAMRDGAGFTISTLPSTYAAGYEVVAVADMNGGGEADILFWNAAANRMAVWYMSGNRRISSNNHVIPSGYKFVGVGDVNIDGRTDVVWTNDDRKILLTVSRGTTYDNYVLGYTYKSTSVLKGFHDVSGDGRADLVFMQTDGARLMAWHMNGRYRTKTTSTPMSASYQAVGQGKFNADKYGDLLFQNPDTSVIRQALYTGSSFTFKNIAIIPKDSSSLMDTY